MSGSFLPRLSEAGHLLPLLRSHIAAAALRCPLPVGLSIDFLPIVEDGLFGYELLPDRTTHTYLIIGCSAQGEPIVRRTIYGVGAGHALRLAAIDRHVLSRSERAVRYTVRRREAQFADWQAAAEAVLAQLLMLFPGRPRQPAALREDAQRCLDGALAVACGHLTRWNPCIRFCGVVDEAQYGYALLGADGEHGELVFQRPDIWMLRWKAPPEAVYESWSVVLPPAEATGRGVQSDLAS